MKFGIVVFPGSNCDQDAYHAAIHVLGQSAELLWHKDADLKASDVLILPGGFAHGDYLRTGAMARFSPIMRKVQEFAAGGGPGTGHLQRLPGAAGGGAPARRDAQEPRAAVPLRARPRPGRADRHALHLGRPRRARCCGFRSATGRATTTRRPTCSTGSKPTGRSCCATRPPRGRSTTRRTRTGRSMRWPASAARRATSSA